MDRLTPIMTLDRAREIVADCALSLASYVSSLICGEQNVTLSATTLADLTLVASGIAGALALLVGKTADPLEAMRVLSAGNARIKQLRTPLVPSSAGVLSSAPIASSEA